MSLNKTATNTTKDLTANVGKIYSNNNLKIRTPTQEGIVSFQSYSPSSITTDNPSDLTITDSTFFYRLHSTGANELQLSIIFSIDFNMLLQGGTSRAFTFSLPTGIETIAVVENVGTGYLYQNAISTAPNKLIPIVSEITNPSTTSVRVVFSNPNQSLFELGPSGVRGEVIIRKF